MRAVFRWYAVLESLVLRHLLYACPVELGVICSFAFAAPAATRVSIAVGRVINSVETGHRIYDLSAVNTR
jgi:hypothetical protein